MRVPGWTSPTSLGTHPLPSRLPDGQLPVGSGSASTSTPSPRGAGGQHRCGPRARVRSPPPARRPRQPACRIDTPQPAPLRHANTRRATWRPPQGLRSASPRQAGPRKPEHSRHPTAPGGTARRTHPSASVPGSEEDERVCGGGRCPQPRRGTSECAAAGGARSRDATPPTWKRGRLRPRRHVNAGGRPRRTRREARPTPPTSRCPPEDRRR